MIHHLLNTDCCRYLPEVKRDGTGSSAPVKAHRKVTPHTPYSFLIGCECARDFHFREILTTAQLAAQNNCAPVFDVFPDDFAMFLFP